MNIESTLPRIFIGSSIENQDVAYAIQENLEFDADVTVWNQDIFKLNKTTLTGLISSLNEFDYAIFVFSPDDEAVIRDKQYVTVRDNVIFEMGLFIGKLGREKVFYIIPHNTDGLHLPSDLIGVTPGKYRTDRGDHNLVAAVSVFCNKVRKEIKKAYPNFISSKDDALPPDKIFTGKWNNFYTGHNDEGKFFGSEEFKVKNENEYYVNEVLSFYIEDFKINRKEGKITFIKRGVLNNRNLTNELRIINNNLFEGVEDGTIKVKYQRIMPLKSKLLR